MTSLRRLARTSTIRHAQGRKARVFPTGSGRKHREGELGTDGTITEIPRPFWRKSFRIHSFEDIAGREIPSKTQGKLFDSLRSLRMTILIG